MDLPEFGALGSVLDAAWARPGNRACHPAIIPRKCSLELTKDGTTLYKLEATRKVHRADMLPRSARVGEIRRAMGPLASTPLLAVRDVTMRFGGIVALDAVSFDMAPGHIVGPLAPNGAGKTTLFNCVSRLYTPSAGDVLFEGQSIVKDTPHHVAALGIGRTFQNLALFPTLSVLQHVMVGVHARTHSDFLSNALRLPWVTREERQMQDVAMEIIAFLDLS